MTKKMFDEAKLRSTVAQQDVALVDRFDKADSILLKATEPTMELRPSTRKSSVVRDTFSMPLDDYALIEKLRLIANKEGRSSTSKSEVVRAGLQALGALSGQQLVQALSKLEKLAPGRKR
ncbi:hypothetical protein ACPJXG_20265 [Janthinobacterium sp. NFX145]|uniref:hypothetical protein n=1 Tax=Janthinobacterium sp. NFX145 TaxID=3415602 RepID=UPI003CC671E4